MEFKKIETHKTTEITRSHETEKDGLFKTDIEPCFFNSNLQQISFFEKLHKQENFYKKLFPISTKRNLPQEEFSSEIVSSSLHVFLSLFC